MNNEQKNEMDEKTIRGNGKHKSLLSLLMATRDPGRSTYFSYFAVVYGEMFCYLRSFYMQFYLFHYFWIFFENSEI